MSFDHRTLPGKARSAAPRAAVAAGDLIEAMGKCFAVVEAFDEDHDRLTTSELARLTGLSRPAARRHLLSLCHFGYAESDGRQFWLTPRVLRLGHSYLASARLPRLVQPALQRLALETGEGATFSVLDEHEVIYLARSSAPSRIALGYLPGMRAPAHIVAAGVVLAAQLDDTALDDWLAQHDFARFTSRTVTDAARFREMVMRARALDYWIGDQQGTVGLVGVAVAARDGKGRCRGALSITAPARGYTVKRLREEIVPQLRETALTLRQDL